MSVEGFRGSKSEDASEYKRAGHVNEVSFGDFVGGTNQGVPPQGKTDWKAEDGTSFSVKRGYSSATNQWAKHWQVFLYGINRIKSDVGFLALGEAGKLLLRALEAFPSDYSVYESDKADVKEVLAALPTSIKGPARVEAVRRKVSEKNQYLASKDRLALINGLLSKELENVASLEYFLRKALFNGTEVEYLAIENGNHFDLFPRELVVSVLASKLEPRTSSAGARSDDLNIAGQKVVLKASTNVIEIEVRNEINHYRELRCNMTAKRAHNLLLSQSEIRSEEPGLYWFDEAQPTSN